MGFCSKAFYVNTICSNRTELHWGRALVTGFVAPAFEAHTLAGVKISVPKAAGTWKLGSGVWVGLQAE